MFAAGQYECRPSLSALADMNEEDEKASSIREKNEKGGGGLGGGGGGLGRGNNRGRQMNKSGLYSWCV